MKIAIVAPVLRSISKKAAYGGIERIIKSLSMGSAEHGHKVVLYAPHGTDLEHENLEVRFTTDENDNRSTRENEVNLFQKIIDEQAEFDIIHSHIEPIIADSEFGNYFDRIKKPVVITFHNQTHIDSHVDYYKSHNELHNINCVFISHDQSEPLNFLPKQTVIYNGINLDNLSYNAAPDPDQLAFLGRITPEKGIVEAINIAKASNKKLLIAAALDETQRDFFENEVKPLIDNDRIIYLGEIDDKAKNELLRNSIAMLFPITWHEPFGLVIVESMATGTPVIANNIGSVSEIVQDGKTGFILPVGDDYNNYASKISCLNEIDRNYCRQYAVENFSEKVMIANYLNYYESIN